VCPLNATDNQIVRMPLNSDGALVGVISTRCTYSAPHFTKGTCSGLVFESPGVTPQISVMFGTKLGLGQAWTVDDSYRGLTSFVRKEP
jgi:hypothetical protein